METAVRGATELRRLGFEPGRVTVGDVSFELVIRPRFVTSSAPPAPTPPDPIEQMLGPEGAALFNRSSRRQADDEGDE